MPAYYNENDRIAAAWLRELIKEGLIADGEVDERSIRDVQPIDLRGFTQCHFFAGIGVWSYALRNAGWEDARPVWTGSCPCQPFSAAGKRKGHADERNLWPEWFRLIRECRPVTVFGEQVSAAVSHGWLDLVSDDLEGAGYTVGACDFPACGVGAPHIRQRLYFVAHASLQRRQQIGGCTLGDEETYGREPNGDNQPASIEQCERVGELAGSELRRPEQRYASERTVSIPDASGELGNAVITGLEGHTGNGDDGNGPGRQRENAVRSASETSELGFWSDSRWHLCADGKYRPVPLEPEIFPLAPRTPGRVGLLRGAGNSLCAPQAQTFIGAYLDSTGTKDFTK